ncbi:MAG TPA: diguanylate cyclase [Acidiferrobacterales bacterium]|jgi:diguanylate cyclase (GGDEF)-like protein/PAS domain S-box-containing protein
MTASASVEPGEIRMLFVDDSRTSRDYYSRIFTKAGYATETADGVDDALARLGAALFDIAIIDYFMPGKNGDALCRAIRQDPDMVHITPAILTASYSDDVIRASLEAGASDCLFKDEPVELLLTRIAAMVRAIGVRKTIERERRYLAGILGSLNEGVYGVDEHNRITFMNPAGLRLLGYDSESELIGRTPHEAFHYALQDGRPNPAETCYLHQAYELGDELPNWESVFWTRQQRPIWVECNVVPLRSAGRHHGSVVAFRDITVLREHIEKLHWQAYHDSLTHLPNRRYFKEALEREFYRLKRSEEVSGVLYIDLDHFKSVNDQAGHAGGDQLLAEVGRLLANRTRVVDVLARLGGDEFGIILQNVERDRVMDIAGSFQEMLSGYAFNFDGRGYTIGASIGVALMDKDSADPEQVLIQADTASYASKKRGGHHARLYRPGDESEVA